MRRFSSALVAVAALVGVVGVTVASAGPGPSSSLPASDPSPTAATVADTLFTADATADVTPDVTEPATANATGEATADVFAPREVRPRQRSNAPVQWGVCTQLGGVVLAPNYTCARYSVPLDYADPTGETIELQLVKRAADGGVPRRGSLFVNPGGPSGSGFDFVAGLGDFLFDPSVLAAYDLIGFDPRGVAYSSALQCFDGTEDPGRYVDFFAWPDTAAKRQTSVDNGRRFNARCAELGGDLRRFMTTTSVARDLDRLRRAVGDEKLNYVGYSYGSFIGEVYANLFPDRVGAVVIDGVLDPVQWSTGGGATPADKVPTWARIGSSASGQATLEEFFRLCDEKGAELCPFAGDSAARFAELHERLRTKPLVFSFPNGVLDAQYLVLETLTYLYSSPAWSTLGYLLVELETLAAADGPVAPAQLRQLQADSEIPLGYAGDEQFLGVVCSDGDHPSRLQDWINTADAAPGYFGQFRSWQDRGCLTWDVRAPDRYTGPWNARTANPILIASTRYDPATPYAGAVSAHALLPNSILLTVEGWGHTTPFLSRCADGITTRYLLGEVLTEQSYSCAQDLDPFPFFGVEAQGAPAADRASKRQEFVDQLRG